MKTRTKKVVVLVAMMFSVSLRLESILRVTALLELWKNRQMWLHRDRRLVLATVSGLARNYRLMAMTLLWTVILTFLYRSIVERLTKKKTVVIFVMKISKSRTVVS